MNVITAKTAGFCFGVKRAVDIVNKEIEKGSKNIYTYGPIIHNESVTEEFNSHGVKIMEESDIDAYEPGIVIIRSHGVTKAIDEHLRSRHEVIDATCPFVKKIHKLVEKHSSEGKYIIVIGDKNHPEVKGIIGWIVSDYYCCIDSAEDVPNITIPDSLEYVIVSQTTFNHKKFQELVEIIDKIGYNGYVLDTICDATSERQQEARVIAGSVDAMFVVGSKSSSNTQKLFEICKKECTDTYYIQSKDDLYNADFSRAVLPSISSVGITAGASTPNKLIEEVQKYVRNEF